MPLFNLTINSERKQPLITALTIYPVAMKTSYVSGRIHPIPCHMVFPHSPSPIDLSPRPDYQSQSTSSHLHFLIACQTRSESISITLYLRPLDDRASTMSGYLYRDKKSHSLPTLNHNHHLSLIASSLTKIYIEDSDLTPSKADHTQKKHQRQCS